MSKIKRFTRFIAVLLLTALSFGPAMAGTGGYGRRNINVNINYNVNATQNFNNLIEANAKYKVYCGYCNNFAEQWNTVLGHKRASYSNWNPAVSLQLATQATISHFTSQFLTSGTVPTADELNAFFNEQVKNYVTGTPFTAQSFCHTANNGGEVCASGELGGMLNWAYNGAAPVGRIYQQRLSDNSQSFSSSGSSQFGGYYSFTPIPIYSNGSRPPIVGYRYVPVYHPSPLTYTTNSSSHSLSGHSISSTTLTKTLSGSMTSNASGTIYTLNYQTLVSPLVLNMNGSGRLEASNGKWLPHPNSLDTKHLVLFDLLGDGFPMIMEWVGPQDGLLVYLTSSQIREYQKTGTVHITGANLFGTMGGWANGYEKLETLDKNHNGKLTGSELNHLYVWQDLNGNAKVDPGELKSVQDLGITEIDTIPNSNLISHFVMNGKKYIMWDWYPNAFSVLKKHS